MTDAFAARFAAARDRFGPLVWGLDPAGKLLERWGFGDCPDGLDRFADRMLEAAAGTVGLVKPQSAFFERHGWRGIRALQRLLAGARSAGLLTVLDVKRGDVGTTNDAYAQAFIGAGAPLESDAVTRTFAACPDRVMPSASRSLLAAGPDLTALRDAAATLAGELKSALAAPPRTADRGLAAR